MSKSKAIAAPIQVAVRQQVKSEQSSRNSLERLVSVGHDSSKNSGKTAIGIAHVMKPGLNEQQRTFVLMSLFFLLTIGLTFWFVDYVARNGREGKYFLAGPLLAFAFFVRHLLRYREEAKGKH